MRRTALIAAALAAVAAPALAHVGAHPENSLAAGFAHPFTGLDHMLAMTAVGLWAGLAAGRAAWAWPAAFVGFMLAGFGLGLGAAPLPGVEAVILASLVALGLAAALRPKAPVILGAAVVAAFALAHGYAHGQEAPAAGALGFGAGFAAATVLLHLAGLALAWTVVRLKAPRLAQAAGLGVAGAGLALAWMG